MHCPYYQARIKRSECWFLVAVLKSYEHVAFDRALDAHESIFEFFVAPSMEDYFIELMERMKSLGVISDLQKLPNRLLDAGQKL